MCSWIWRRNLLCWEWGSEVFIIRNPFIFPKNFLCWEFEVSMCSWHETLRAWRIILWHECFLLFMKGKNCYHQWGFSKTCFKKISFLYIWIWMYLQDCLLKENPSVKICVTSLTSHLSSIILALKKTQVLKFDFEWFFLPRLREISLIIW